MNYCKIIVTFFSDFSRGEIIATIGIFIALVIFIATIFFYIWWDTRKKRHERIDAFRETILPFKGILETSSIPDHASYNGFITNLFSDQDKAMTIIRDRLNRQTKTEFDKKWAEYKVEREGYKRYWDTHLMGKVSLHKGSNRIIKLIDEIIKIIEKN